MSSKLKLQKDIQSIDQQIEKIKNSQNFNWIKEIQIKNLLQKRNAIQTELSKLTGSTGSISQTSISHSYDEKTNSDFEPQGLETFLNRTLSDELLEDLINIWIVLLGGRQACLIETSHYDDKARIQQTKLLQNFVKINKLHWKLDPQSLKDYPRYLVSKQAITLKKSDKQLGELLGMTYLKSDYNNFCLPRTVIRIHEWTSSKKNISLWTEVSLTPEISMKKC